MRGLLALAYAAGCALFNRMARRALRRSLRALLRSRRHAARAEWCSKRASDLNPTKPTNGDAP